MASAAYRSWGEPARSLARAVDSAVSAAAVADDAAFRMALTELRAFDPLSLQLVLGSLARELMERAHPDGLDSDDVEATLISCVGAATSWFAEFDARALIAALTEALGVGAQVEPSQTAPAPAAVVTHGLLLVADLVRTSGEPLAPVLDGALSELRRAQTIELP